MSMVLLTGSSGFIGTRLAGALGQKHNVVCLSRNQPTDDMTFVRGSFHSFEDLRRLDAFKIDVLVHLGAVVGGCSEEDGIEVNVAGTRRLLRYLIDRGCRKFVLASSIAAVGCLDAAFLPVQLPIPDDHPCLARDAYGLSKALMEEVTRYLARKYDDADFTNLRVGAVIDDRDWTPAPLKAGSPLIIPFCQLAAVALSDVLQAFSLAVELPKRPGVRVYNVVGPDASCDDSVPAILRSLSLGGIERLDLSYYEQAGLEHDPIYSINPIRQELGYKPETTVRPLRFMDKRMNDG